MSKVPELEDAYKRLTLSMANTVIQKELWKEAYNSLYKAIHERCDMGRPVDLISAENWNDVISALQRAASKEKE